MLDCGIGTVTLCVLVINVRGNIILLELNFKARVTRQKMYQKS